MKKITVKRIKPGELPPRFYYLLNYIYGTDLSGFTVLYDSETEVLFVNADRVTDHDLDDFLRILDYSGKYINDPDSPISPLTDAVFQKYGYETLKILLDGYMERQKKRMNKEAEKLAPGIIRKIEKYMDKEDMGMSFCDMEYVLYHIGKFAEGQKKQTVYEMVGYGTVLAAEYGYLLGKGLLKAGDTEEAD